MQRLGFAKGGTALGFPLFLLALVALAVTFLDPLARFGAGLPPDEGIAIERGTTGPAGIEMWVRGDGRDDTVLAQVQVDGAYWVFKQTPEGPLGQFDGARIDIPYPWVAGEAHHITLVTSTGATFDYSIEVARPATVMDLGALIDLALLGIFVGVVPVALGLAVLPVLRRMGTEGIVFAMALTVGLLAYLLVDTMAEGRGQEPADRQGPRDRPRRAAPATTRAPRWPRGWRSASGCTISARACPSVLP